VAARHGRNPELKRETRHRWLTAIRQGARLHPQHGRAGNAGGTLPEGLGERFGLHEHLLAPNSQFRLGHELAAVAVLPKKRWPSHQVQGEKRGITREEHRAIVAREQNPERKVFINWRGTWARLSRTSPSSKPGTLIGKATSSALPGENRVDCADAV